MYGSASKMSRRMRQKMYDPNRAWISGYHVGFNEGKDAEWNRVEKLGGILAAYQKKED